MSCGRAFSRAYGNAARLGADIWTRIAANSLATDWMVGAQQEALS